MQELREIKSVLECATYTGRTRTSSSSVDAGLSKFVNLAIWYGVCFPWIEFDIISMENSSCLCR